MATKVDSTRIVIVASFTIAFLLFIFGSGITKTHSSQKEGSLNTTTISEEEPPIIKDSIDVLIEQRSEQEFNSTIFAGLRFGSTQQSVEKALKNKVVTKSYSSTLIPIQVPNGDRVEEVIVRDYAAVYHNDGLVSLILYANEANLLDALGVLYTTKYGKTKDYDWRFSNCEISLEKKSRTIVPMMKTNVNNPDWYYNSYDGTKNPSQTTKEQYFLSITYINYTLQREMERDIYVRDSIERKKLEKERLIRQQQEKELAEKLATEAATNI